MTVGRGFDPKFDGFSFFNDAELAGLARDIRARAPSPDETAGYLDQSPILKAIHNSPIVSGLEQLILGVNSPPLIMSLQRIFFGEMDGLCYGMAAVAIDFYAEPDQKPRYLDTSFLTRDECVRRIVGAHIGQTNDVLRTIKFAGSQVVSTFLQPLSDSFNLLELSLLRDTVDDGFNPRVIALFHPQIEDSRGSMPHAAVAFQVAQLQNGISRISIYDPNRGNKTLYIYVNGNGSISPSSSFDRLGYEVNTYYLRNFIVFR